MKILKYSVIFFFIIFCNFFANAEEIKIKFKIGNDIITNKDIENEKRYLISLNNDLLKISKKELNKIAIDSIIRETIKKNELS